MALNLAEKVNSLVWGSLLLSLLLGTGLMFSVRLRLFQLTHFPQIMRKTFLSLFRRGSSEGSSRLRAVSSALGASMGTGNIIGVATALTLGGAGAVFWMWVSAFLGMALAYCENYLSALFRKKSVIGTPASLEFGTGKRYLAVIFSFFCILASLGMGNMTQTNSIAQSARASFGIPCIFTGILCAVPLFLIISGGIKRIGAVSQILIPILSAVYIAASLSVIIKNYSAVPCALRDIFTGAFGIDAVSGGISGEAVKLSISAGLRRGAFSNEAGLGSSPMLNSSAAGTAEKQGLWAVFEVFLDTIVCCTLTALAVMTSGALSTGNEGAQMITDAFRSIMGGFSPYFTSVSTLLFAFATLISWYFCGECCVKYLFTEKAVPYYRIVYTFCAVFGAYSGLSFVWTLSDIFNGLMAFPNLAGLIILRKRVRPPFHRAE